MGWAELGDAELVEGCRAGDQGAWNELVDRYARYVHAIVVRAYRLPAPDAEDVFQEVFTRVFEHLDDLRNPGALRPWIAQTTRRCCLDQLRGGATEVPVESHDELAADDLVERLDDAMDVRRALSSLSDDCAEILDRFFCRDESYRTIGAALELPAGTIASRISRCLERLRTVLGKKSLPSGVG